MRVLIVDDEPGICQRLQRELRKEGCEVEYTTSPVGVLERLRNAEQEGKAYALLLLDLRMPKMDGLALLKKIREARLDLDVVIITGYGDEDKAIESIRLGALDYLRKPISLEELHTAVFRVQQKRAAEEKRALEYSVLVVDDERELCARIKRELDKEGYRTAVAYDGLEGLDYFSHHRVDVAIVDIRMPRMSGLEMLEKCREISDDFVSIIITGHGDHERAIQALQLGVFNYLRKPISLEELVISVGKGIEFLHLRRGLAARRRELEIETALKKQYAQNLEKMVEERTRELRESEEKYRTLVEEAPVAICNVDIKGKITYVNKTILQGTGYSREELVGKNGFRLGLIPHETLKLLRRRLKEKLMGKPPSPLEIQFKRKDGEWMWLEIRGRLISEHGVPVGVQIIGEDITERKRAEEALRESEQRFRDVARTTGDWIWEVDAEGRYTYASPVVEQVLGYTPEEVLGKRYYDFFHPDDREELKTLAQETFRRKEPFARLVNRNVHKDGRTVVLETSGVPLTDAEDNLLGYRGADRDVTSRVWREEMLLALNAAAAAVQRAARTPEAVFTAVMEQLQALGLTGAVTLLDEERERFTIRYAAVTSQALAQAEQLTGRKAVGYTFPVEQLPIGRQILAGEAVFVPDVAALLAPVVPAPVRSLMSKAMRLLNMPRGVVAPLSVGGEVIGFLGVSAARMTEADIPAVTAFANQMAAALENARLFEAEQRRRQELEALREISLAITAQLRLDKLLQNIVEQGCCLLEVKAGGVYLVDEVRGDLELLVSHGYTRDYTGARLASGEGLSGKVLQSGEPLTVNDYRHWEGRSPGWEAEPLTAVLGVPLKHGEQVIGVLDFAEVARPRSFDEHDVWLATLFASQAAIAIENARLYEETRRRAERLAVVNRIARAASATLHLDDLMETVYQEVAPIFQADAFFIALYDEETNELDFRIRVDEGAQEPPERRPVGSGLTGLVVTEKRPLLIRNFEEEQDRLPRQARLWGTMKAPASWLGVPMLIGERVVGVICVQAYRPRAYGEEEELLLSTIADQVAVAIEQARLYEAEREERELAEALEEAAAAVSSTLDLDQVLDRILEQVERVVAGDAFNIMLVEDSNARAVRWRGYERMGVKDQIATFTLPITKYPNLAKMTQTGKPVVTMDTAANPDWVPREGWGWLRSYVAAPIQVTGLTVGFLNVDGTRPGQFGLADAHRLEAFASHAAAAIENARLFEQAQQEIAERKRAEEELQHALKKLRKTLGATIQAMASTVETRDPYTASHQRQVANLARAIATEMGLSKERIEGIRMAAVIHDIGKITVPTDILNKAGELTENEFGIIKCHPKVGYDILKTIEFPWPIAQIILQHHERMDGSGYPQGLSGEEIILEARILAVADVVEAMASFRPYRPSHGLDKALEEISQNKGVLYDAEVVDACLRLFTEKGFKLE